MGKQGWTAKKAALELARLQEAQKKGTGEPVTLREKREIARAEREKRVKEGITFKQYFEDMFVPQAEIGNQERHVKKRRSLEIGLSPSSVP